MVSLWFNPLPLPTSSPDKIRPRFRFSLIQFLELYTYGQLRRDDKTGQVLARVQTNCTHETCKYEIYMIETRRHQTHRHTTISTPFLSLSPNLFYLHNWELYINHLYKEPGTYKCGLYLCISCGLCVCICLSAWVSECVCIDGCAWS